MIEQIINNDNFKLAYYIKAEYLEEQVSQLRNNNVINRNWSTIWSIWVIKKQLTVNNENGIITERHKDAQVVNKL